MTANYRQELNFITAEEFNGDFSSILLFKKVFAWAASDVSVASGVIVNQNNVDITYTENIFVQVNRKLMTSASTEGQKEIELSYTMHELDTAIYLKILAVEFSIKIFLEDTAYNSANALSSAMLSSMINCVQSHSITMVLRNGASILKAVPMYDVKVNATIGEGSTPSISFISTRSVLNSFRNRFIDSDMSDLYACLMKQASDRGKGSVFIDNSVCNKPSAFGLLDDSISLNRYESLPDVEQVYYGLISNHGEHLAACSHFEDFIQYGLSPTGFEDRKDVFIAIQYAYQEIDASSDLSYTRYHEFICDNSTVVHQLVEAMRTKSTVRLSCENSSNRKVVGQNADAVWSTYEHSNSLIGSPSFSLCVNCIGIEKNSPVFNSGEVLLSPCSRDSATTNAFFTILKVGFERTTNAPEPLLIDVRRGKRHLDIDVTLDRPGHVTCLAVALNNTFSNSTTLRAEYGFDPALHGTLDSYLTARISKDDIVKWGRKGSSSADDAVVSISALDLRPSTSYAVMCLTETFAGLTNRYRSVLNRTVVTETLCCPEVIFPLSYDNLLDGSTNHEVIEIFGGTVEFLYHIDSSLVMGTSGIEVSLVASIISCGNGLPLSLGPVRVLPEKKFFSISSLAESLIVGDHRTNGLYKSGFVSSKFIVSSEVSACVRVTGTVRYINGEQLVPAAYVSSFLPVQIVEGPTLVHPMISMSKVMFNNQGTEIHIFFSGDSDRGESLANSFGISIFSCSQLFIFSKAMERSCMCQFVSDRMVRAVLITSGSSYLSLFDEVTLLSETLKAKCIDFTGNTCDSYLFAESTTLLIGYPHYPVKPQIRMSTSGIVGICSIPRFDLSKSTGKGSSPWRSITWTVSSLRNDDTVTNIQAYLNLYFNERLDVVTVPRRLFANDTYTFQIEARNMFDEWDIVSEDITFVGSTVIPEVSVYAPNSVYRYERLVIVADAFISTCSTNSVVPSRKSLEYKWEVYRDGLYSAAHPSVGSNDHVYELNPFNVSVGSTYCFRVTVTNVQASDSLRASQDQTCIYVNYGSIYSVLNGGLSYTTIESDSLLVINATESYLRDLNIVSYNEMSISRHSLLYVFSCVVASGELFGTDCVSASGDTYPSESSNGVGSFYASMNFNAKDFASDTTYEISVSIYPVENEITGRFGVTDPNRHTLLVYVNTGSPIPKITFDDGMVKVNHDEELRIRAFVETESVSCFAAWKAFESEELIPLKFDFTGKELSRGTSIFALFLPPHSLEPSLSYIFELTATYLPGGGTSIAKYIVAVNAAPIGGSIRVNPNIGISLETRFMLLANDWTDDPADYPLQFRFRWYMSDPKNGVLVSDYQYERVIYTALGGGDVNNGFLVVAAVHIKDLFGAQAYAEADVVVTSNLDLLSLYSQTQILVSVSSGYYLDMISILNVLLLATSAVNCDSAPDCASLNRYKCSITPGSCGRCLDSHPFGAYGPANSQCYAHFSELTSSANLPQLNDFNEFDKGYSTDKSCLNDCSSNGACVFHSFLGEEVSSCQEYSSCRASCICHAGFYGRDCSLYIGDYNTHRDAKAYIAYYLFYLMGMSTTVTESVVFERVQSVVLLLQDLSLVMDSTYTNCLEMIISTINMYPEYAVTSNNLPVVLDSISTLLEKGLEMTESEYLRIIQALSILSEYSQMNLNSENDPIAIYSNNLRFLTAVEYLGSLGKNKSFVLPGTYSELALKGTSEVVIINENAVNGSIKNTVINVGISIVEILVHTAYNTGNSSKVDVSTRVYPELGFMPHFDNNQDVGIGSSLLEYLLTNHYWVEYDEYVEPTQQIICRVSHDQKPYEVPLNCTSSSENDIPPAPLEVQCSGKKAYLYQYICPYKLTYPKCVLFDSDTSTVASLAEMCSVEYYDGAVTKCLCNATENDSKSLLSNNPAGYIVSFEPSNLMSAIHTEIYAFNASLLAIPFSLYEEVYYSVITYSALSILLSVCIVLISLFGLLKYHPLHLVKNRSDDDSDNTNPGKNTASMEPSYLQEYHYYNAQYLLDNNIPLVFRNKLMYYTAKLATSFFPEELNLEKWYMRWVRVILEENYYSVIFRLQHLETMSSANQSSDIGSSKVHPLPSNNLGGEEANNDEESSLTVSGFSLIRKTIALFTTSALRTQKILGLCLRVLTIMACHAMIALLIYPDKYLCENVVTSQQCYSQQPSFPIYMYTYPYIRIDGRQERGDSSYMTQSDHLQEKDYYKDASLCIWSYDDMKCSIRNPLGSYSYSITVVICTLLLSLPFHSFCKWALEISTSGDFFLSIFYVDESVYEESYQDSVRKKVANHDLKILEQYYESLRPEEVVVPDTRTMLEKQMDLLYSDSATNQKSAVIFRKKPQKVKGGHAYYDPKKISADEGGKNENLADDLKLNETGGYEKIKKKKQLHDTVKKFIGPVMLYARQSKMRGRDRFVIKFSFSDFPTNTATPQAELNYLHKLSRYFVDRKMMRYTSSETNLPDSSGKVEHHNKIDPEIARSYLKHMLFLNDAGRFKKWDRYTLFKGYSRCDSYLVDQIQRARLKADYIIGNLDLIKTSQHDSPIMGIKKSWYDNEGFIDESRVFGDIYLYEEFLVHSLPLPLQEFSHKIFFCDSVAQVVKKMSRHDQYATVCTEFNRPGPQFADSPKRSLHGDSRISSLQSTKHNVGARVHEVKELFFRNLYKYWEGLIFMLLVIYTLLAIGLVLYFGISTGSVSTIAWAIFVVISIVLDALIYIPIVVGMTHILIYDLIVYHLQIMHQVVMTRYKKVLEPEITMDESELATSPKLKSSSLGKTWENFSFDNCGGLSNENENDNCLPALIQHFNPVCRASRVFASKEGFLSRGKEGITYSTNKSYKTYNNSSKKAVLHHDSSEDEYDGSGTNRFDRSIAVFLCNLSDFDLSDDADKSDFNSSHGKPSVPFLRSVLYEVAFQVLAKLFSVIPKWLQGIFLEIFFVVPFVVLLLLSFFYLYLFQHSLLLPLTVLIGVVVLVVMLELGRRYDKHSVDCVRFKETLLTLMEDVVHRPRLTNSDDTGVFGTGQYRYNSSDISFDPSDAFKARLNLADITLERIHDLFFSPVNFDATVTSKSPPGSPKSRPQSASSGRAMSTPSPNQKLKSSNGTEGSYHVSDRNKSLNKSDSAPDSSIYPQPVFPEGNHVSSLDQTSYIATKSEFVSRSLPKTNCVVENEPMRDLKHTPTYSPHRLEVKSYITDHSTHENDETGSLSRLRLPPLHSAEQERERGFLPNDSYVSIFSSSKKQRGISNTYAANGSYLSSSGLHANSVRAHGKCSLIVFP